jgi:hypothetical protein
VSAAPAYPPGRPLDPLHGTHDPVASTPDRVPGSVRRTTTIEMLRPDGVRRDLRLHGAGRDILTAADGTVTVLDEATMHVVVDYLDAVSVTAITTTPSIPGLQEVRGRSAATGFRAAVDAAIDVAAHRGRPVYQLLDDIPVATLVSGYAVGFAGGHPGGDEGGAGGGAAGGAGGGAGGGSAGVPVAGRDERPWRRADGMAELQVADLCAGFQAGGTIMRAREEGTRGAGGAVTGPVAPSIERADDPWAWHAFGALPPDGMRRRRRIDVRRHADDPGLVEVDALFRDSHMGDDGYETIVHEYVVVALVDLRSMTFRHAEAVPRVLPWYECPQAAASAARLVGRTLDALRPAVRAEFLGPTTCTHLNDTFRALEDVAVLARALPVVPM